jgi:hypothetical protein
MKATLIKENDFYYSLSKDNKIIAEIDGHPLKSITGKLSKQNCDEIFGVVDVEKLAQDYAKSQCEDLHDELGKTGAEWGWETALDFKNGFNKAMELNKDKQFTLEDMRRVIAYGENHRDMDEGKVPYQTFVEFIESLQPTEIEVEVEMETKKQLVNGYENQPDNVIGFVAKYKHMLVPKLDADGCLILRKL